MKIKKKKIPYKKKKKLLDEYQNKNYDVSEKLSLSLSKKYPNDGFSWKILGLTFFETNKISDALEAGVRGNVDAFISARNRLAILLGGQERAAVVLSGMLGKSLFVEEAHHAMVARAASNGHDWTGQGPMPPEVLLDMFLEPVKIYF